MIQDDLETLNFFFEFSELRKQFIDVNTENDFSSVVTLLYTTKKLDFSSIDAGNYDGFVENY